MTGQPQTSGLAAFKAGQQATWAAGNYARIGNNLVLIGELLCEAADLRAGDKVLDVATGSGNAAISAARRNCDVTGMDYVPAWVEYARKRADAEQMEVSFEVGDAEDLPYTDASFDVVLSTLGVMFAPNQQKAAAELLRVARPGGTVAMASWVPDSYVGDLFKTIGKHVPPLAGLKPPFRWGTEEGLDELLDGGIGSLQTRRRTLVWRFPSVPHHVGFMREYYGPLSKAFGALDKEGQDALESDLISLAESYDSSDDGTAVLHADYLEVVAARR